ncbi:cationic amino acid transporter 2 isoform X2 [Lucilia sericata]|uniref:cationic amino acid transporter 2 isoform X2 n=1 Tax=Lucilia sericata TaxID=13632 RepID=UPI0018A84141|nr:cationic amino acid transporter 2 isoform X2 [Lucilia sericata]
MVQQPSYWKVLTRRKQLSQEGADGESKLNRVLGLYDLTALGVGSTLGAGVYVLAGQIAKDQAGPSVMLSFAIAALASLLAGICYAEFGARVPKAGSAYVYSYVCIGEFAAFVIGWNLILEYMIGTASVCRGISLYLDTLINDTLKTTFAEVAPMNVSFLGSYFDFFACGLVAVFGVALAFGVEASAIANNFCTCLNLFILLFVIIAGSIKANFSNWTIDVDTVNKTEIPPDTDLGMGGFFPFGFTGTLKGAATCFFGFVGFDCIATTGEEVQNPRKNIPRSILLSLLVIFLCYFGVSTVITLMVPYYLQDPNAPLPSAFKVVGWNFAMWLVSIGGLIGLLASLFGALFPLPRVMYSMAQDGLMFRVFAQIHPRFRVPVIGSIVAAMLTALIAGLFDLAQLVNLLSIGTLLAYSVVAISITILRYMDNADTFGKSQSNGNIDSVNGENGHSNGNGNHHSNANGNGYNVSENSLLTSKGERTTFKAVMVQLFNFRREYTPNELSTIIVGTLITVFCILSAGIGLIFMQAYDALINNQTWVLVLLVVLCALTALVLLCICLQPRELCTRVFTVPFVPFVPAISIFINIYLMLQLDVMTWIRFGVWMAIGLSIYFFYGLPNSFRDLKRQRVGWQKLKYSEYF